MPKFTFLHLSDFHLDTKKWTDTKLVVDALLEDVRKRYLDGVCPDIVLFSGDLVNAGGKSAPFSELDQDVINKILSTTNLTTESVCLAPGNHDIDREVVRRDAPIQSGLLTSLVSREACNKFYQQHKASATSGPYFDRLEAFDVYSSKFSSASQVNKNPFFRTTIHKISGSKIGVVALNTAWLSSGEEGDTDRGRLIIPEHAIIDALSDISSCDFKVAIFHHPLEYLSEHNRYDCKALLRKNFNLICTGHLHQPSPEFVQSAIGQSIHSEAGALYHSRRFYNGYCFIVVDTDARKVEFIHRRWEDSPAFTFADANNVGDGGRTSFFWGDPDEVKRVGSLIDVNRELKAFLNDQANEHMLASQTNTSAPKSLSELYVDVPITERSSARADTKGSTGRLFDLSEIVELEQPVIIYGSRESGKTTFSYNLAIRICDGLGSVPRAPVMINLALISAGSGMIAREAKRVLSLAQMQDKFEALSISGSFVFIFDNADLLDRRKSSMIKEFAVKYPKNKYVIICDEAPGVLKQDTKSALGFEVSELYIQPLKRRAIRDLTKRWLEPSGLYSNEAFHTVLKKIETSNLPSTAYVVSMIAWTLEKHNAVGMVNEAALLERFIDGILNKANLIDVSRGSLDYTIKESFLSELSKHLVDGNSLVIEKNDLVKFAIEFIEKRSWTYDASAFVEDLISSGVLASADNIVAFRYRCLREYFLARYMIEHKEYRDHIFSPENYLNFEREIDLFTGLRRRDVDVVRKVMELADETYREWVKFNDLSNFDDCKLRFYGENSINRPDSLEDLNITDDAIENFLDERDDDMPSLEGPDDLERKSRSRADRMAGLTRAFMSITLLGKVVRNSELIVDAELKREATLATIRYFSGFMCLLIYSFDNATSENASPEDKERFERLSSDQMQMVENFIKLGLPVIFSSNLHAALSTAKLKGVIEGIVRDNTGEIENVVKLMSAFSLLDIACSEGNGSSSSSIKIIEDMLKSTSSRYMHQVIGEKLLSAYFQPNVGPDNRRLIEGIYSQNQVKLVGAHTGSGAQTRLVRAMRDERTKALIEDKVDADDE